MRYHHIFWDFNGTVIDDVNTALGCVNDLLERKGRAPITLTDYYNFVETPIIGFYRHILPPEEIDFTEISAAYHSDYARRSDQTRPADGILRLLEKLKNDGAHQYIITANYIEETTAIAKNLGILPFIDQISASEDTAAGSKIERAESLFNSLNIHRNDAVLIGDTLHDLETANALGIDCILVTYGHQGKRLLKSHNVFAADNLCEVEKIIYDCRRVDFHTHSTCSDGTMTPSQLVRHAKESGLSAVALTDHDSVDGISEAAEEAKRIGIEFIPGIEFSAAEETETHIIGLFVNPESPILLSTIDKLKNSRKRRMEDICRKLRSLGFSITHQEALDIAGGNFVGRAHIAKLMVEKGYCKSVKECFDKYIGLGKPAYSEKNELTAVEAVKAIRASGGLAFLAHLNQTGFDTNKLRELLAKLKSAGLTGIEGYYPEYSSRQIAEYRKLALESDLVLGGGSDFHGNMKPHISIGIGTGDLNIPYYVLEHMKNIKEAN